MEFVSYLNGCEYIIVDFSDLNVADNFSLAQKVLRIDGWQVYFVFESLVDLFRIKAKHNVQVTYEEVPESVSHGHHVD